MEVEKKIVMAVAVLQINGTPRNRTTSASSNTSLSDVGEDSDWEDIEDKDDDEEDDDDFILFQDSAEPCRLPLSFTCSSSGSPSSYQSCAMDKGHCWVDGLIDVVDACLSKFTEKSEPEPEKNGRIRKVHFKEDDLVQVVEFEDDEDSKQDRCYWTFFLLNRARFKDRISCTEEALGSIFSEQHRDKIYTERILPFLKSQDKVQIKPTIDLDAIPSCSSSISTQSTESNQSISEPELKKRKRRRHRHRRKKTDEQC